MKLRDIKNSDEVKVMRRINNLASWCYLNCNYEGNEDDEVEVCWANGDGKFIVILAKGDVDLRYYTDEQKSKLEKDYYKIIDENELMSKEEWEKLHSIGE